MTTAAVKLVCAKRELGHRRWKYPDWVAAGRMKQDKADHEIATMEAIVADYQAMVDAEKAKGDLFGGAA